MPVNINMRTKIVLCLILDSRQNNTFLETEADWIVLCLILDSRQNGSPRI